MLVGAALLLLLLVGGLSQVGSQSRNFDAASERALAVQATVLAQQSNATASSLRSLMGDLPAQTRQSLQVGLEGAVQQSAAQAVRAAQVSRSMPATSPAGQLAGVFAERASSVAAVRAALDGFLGLAPLPVAGASATGGSGAAGPGGSALLSAEQTAGSIATAGAALSRADAQYRSVRATLAAGHARMPSSVWVTDPAAWAAGAVAAQVDLVATSPTLSISHYVVLRTVRLSPAALPAPPGTPPGVSVLSPTSALGVTAVVANLGSAAQPSVRTRIIVSDQGSGASTTRVVTSSLALGASVVLPSVTVPVTPGSAYLLTVQVVLPAGQTLTLGTAIEQALRIAPAT